MVSVVVERMYDWSLNWGGMLLFDRRVSVVVERMYDWSSLLSPPHWCCHRRFSCCWKDVRLKRNHWRRRYDDYKVSVVVERMYDWSYNRYNSDGDLIEFQLLLKGCTIEAFSQRRAGAYRPVSVVVERMYDWSLALRIQKSGVKSVSVVVERMYDWSSSEISKNVALMSFSCCWKDVRLKPW